MFFWGDIFHWRGIFHGEGGYFLQGGGYFPHGGGVFSVEGGCFLQGAVIFRRERYFPGGVFSSRVFSRRGDKHLEPKNILL